MTPTQLDDEQLLEVLQRRADQALPTMALDPAATLAGGRRHRRRRHLTVAASAATTGLALTFMTAQVIDFGALTGNSPEFEQQTSAAGDEAHATTLDLAPGVRATVLPAERLLTDGTTALVLGLIAANVSANGTELAVVANDGVNAASFQDAPWLDTDLEIALLEGDALSQRQYWDAWGTLAPLTADETQFWTRGGVRAPDMFDPALMGGRPAGLASDEGWAMSTSTDDGTWIIVGFAPLGTNPTAEANVTLREALTAHDGSELTVLALPTFDVGAADGRRMFAATIAPGAGPAQPTVEGPTTALERIPVYFNAS